MDQEILDYINSQRIGVLAMEMMDGSPHAATVHYAVAENPLMFLFETDRQYRKAEALFGREVSRASLVLGFDEKEMKTLQIDGEVKLIEENEREALLATYHKKFPEKVAMAEKHDLVFFTLTPTWWRFTDWTKPKGKAILTSTDFTSATHESTTI